MTDGITVTVWRIPLPERAPEPHAWALLDARERERAERFIHDRDRHRFVAAHAGLRLVLAAETGRPPSALRFVLEPQGKPRLDRPSLSFNLSHSGPLAVVATCRGSAVGIDVEMAGRMRDLDGLAAMVMTPREQADFAALSIDRRQAAFLRLWTRKEALLKADGRGLMHDPRKVEVGLDDNTPRIVLLDDVRWTLADLALAPDAPAAVCVAGGLASVRQRGVDSLV